MEKIPTALLRDPNNRAKVLPEITPGCEWVFAGEGVPTRKYDGTCVMLDEYGFWWARREVKHGKGEPEEFRRVNYDEVTGKTIGWEPMYNSSFKKFLDEAIEHTPRSVEFLAGTYELVGPKINGNPEKREHHSLVSHEKAEVIPDGYLDYYSDVNNVIFAVKDFCERTGAEGVVWHHPDGRMAKLKARDL